MPDVYAVKSYSQEGEDMILRRLFERKSKGFYVDVGAHHPQRFSNTHYFYKQGWTGINIDATPGSMRVFQATRPRDANIEAAISGSEREMTFYMLDDPALNSLDESLAQRRVRGGYRIIEERRVTTRRLRDVLRDHMPEGQSIDFISVDVEGQDLEVLQSNDWRLYRPAVLLVESSSANIEEVERSPIHRFLHLKGFVFFAKTPNTIMFRDGRNR
jgi:FkbM family methyltransferase